MRKIAKRNYGLDIYRIFCCVGVLVYHIADDIYTNSTAKLLFFAVSFCVPGFFVLSGYFAGAKKEVSFESCEKKAGKTLLKLFGWVCFWCIIRFFRITEFLNPAEQFFLSFKSEGIVPVGWFLFTYSGLLIIEKPLNYLLNKCRAVFALITAALLVLNMFGILAPYIGGRVQAFHVHLFPVYFMAGMLIGSFKDFKFKKKALNYIAILLFSAGAAGSFVYLIKTADGFEPGILPQTIYGTWFHTVSLLCFFVLFSKMPFFKAKFARTALEKMSANTFCVYMMHLPVYMYFAMTYPVISMKWVVFYVAAMFVLAQIVAEIFKKLPILRKIV